MTDSVKIEVKTSIDYGNKLITQQLLSSDPAIPDLDSKVRDIINLKEESVKLALVKLGWIPPEDHLSIENIFSEIYMSNKYSDPHQELADRLRISRTDAKVKCYQYLYNSKFIQDYVTNARK